MPYLRGDYPGGVGRGDYMRADPGFFGDLFRGIGHVVGGAVGGLLTGGPIGGIIGAVKGTIGAVNVNTRAGINEAAQGANPGELPTLPVSTGMIRPGALTGGPPGVVMTSPLGTPVSSAAIARQEMAMGLRARRSHPNKATYVIRGGGTSRWGPGGQLQVIPKGSTQVPNRRMNVANGRALRRALRRVAGFGKLAKRSRRAVSMAASALGVRHRAAKKRR
jgi:hypothetical protein